MAVNLHMTNSPTIQPRKQRLMFNNARKIAVFAVVAVFSLLPATFASAAPAIQQWQTANGARVFFVPAPELPIVDSTLR